MIEFAQGYVYPNSTVRTDDAVYSMVRLDENGERRLVVQGATEGFTGEAGADGMLVCTLSPANATALRRQLSWLNPTPLDTDTSFGFGDRLGIATPGHIRALCECGVADQGQPVTVGPIFAQQSVRENARTGRSPQGVLDDAMWGVFQAGWRQQWGADADHVMEIRDLWPFVEAGYSFFTIDPSKHVDNAATSDDLSILKRKATQVPWSEWGTSLKELHRRYCEKALTLGEITISFDEKRLLRAVVKYGRAVAHTIALARELEHLMNGRRFELELSVDESEAPTSVYEHFFIVSELKQQGVCITSLAPRYVGKFQKGVDYIGDVEAFAREFALHVAVAHHFGDYRISVHTGSDKFSIYRTIAEQSNGRVHVKTAGTSYLEALRVAARHAPPLFANILDLAHANFEKDRATYSLDADIRRVPVAAEMNPSDFPALLDAFDGRQVLHVTYGSVLRRYGRELMTFLREHEAEYMETLAQHFKRHLLPFM